MSQYHSIENLHFIDNSMVLIIDGEEKKFQLATVSQRLMEASELERNQFEISPSGYGIHWPLIDEDLSVDGLLGVIHSRKSIEETS